MAGEVGDKGLPYLIRNWPSCLKVHDVEEVARVLAIQRRTDLAAIELSRVEASDLYKEFIGFLCSQAQCAFDGRH